MAHFMIDPMSRSITMKSALQNIIQHDHNAERAIFEVPRYIQEKDMLSCSKIEIHYINMGSDKSKQSADVYIVDDVHISTRSDNVVEFSWLISKNATRYAGSTSFLVRFIHLNGTEIEYAWHTEPYKSLAVSDGMDNGEPVDAFFSDVLEAWKREVVSYLHSSIQQKADETLATIPEDYATLDSTTKQNTAKISRNDKRITNLEHGIPPELFETDSSVAYFKSVPDKALPYAEIQHVGGITRKCNNLIPFPYHGAGDEFYAEIYEENGDGSITVKFTPAYAAECYFIISDSLYLPAGTYYFSLYGNTNTSGYVCANGNYYSGEFTLSTGTNVRIELNNSWIDENYTETVYPMLNRGDTPSSYEPYFQGLRTAKVTEIESVGANIIPFPYVSGTSKTENGVTWTVNSDGSIKVKGTAQGGNASFYLYDNKTVAPAGIKKGETYIVSSYADKVYAYFNIYENGTQGALANSYDGTPKTYLDSYYGATIYLLVLEGNTVDTIVYPMINKGTTALPYKPYSKHTLEIPQEIVADTEEKYGYGYSVRDNLFNYIDWEKQLFVKRVGKKILNGSEDWSTWGSTTSIYTTALDGEIKRGTQVLHDSSFDFGIGSDDTYCTAVGIKGAYTTDSWKAYLNSNPITVYYELAEPQYTDISHLITADNFIEVEGDGIIKMVNECDFDVPTVITYMLKEETV